MIPEDWSLRSLGDVVTFLDDRRRPVRDADRASMRGTIPYYGASGIIDYVNDYLFDEDLILLGEDGENILSRNRRLAFRIAGKAWVNNHAHVLKPNSDVDIGYLSESLESLNYERFNSGTAQPKLTKQTCFGIPIPLPLTLAEQEAIADALTDADALVESLEQLLTKKRQIKTGAMQELLTGKKRLPGFSGEWEERALFDLAGGSKELFDDGDWIESEHITNEGIRLIQTGNIGVGCFIERCDKKYIFEESFVSLRCKEIRRGDLLICRLANPAGRSCVLPEIGETKIITSVDVTIFRPPASVANRVFLANTFSTDQWFRAVSNQSGGTTHKRISRGALGRLKIRAPLVEEQTAIATILSDMDAEIAALESRLSKARLLKQGMMQELLTGRIRLV